MLLPLCIYHHFHDAISLCPWSCPLPIRIGFEEMLPSQPSFYIMDASSNCQICIVPNQIRKGVYWDWTPQPFPLHMILRLMVLFRLLCSMKSMVVYLLSRILLRFSLPGLNRYACLTSFLSSLWSSFEYSFMFSDKVGACSVKLIP
jgi:hypothetical protein